MVFVELPTFIRCADDLFSDEDLAELQNTLMENPDAGDVIPGGAGLRKLRVALPGRGKRGGARVIYPRLFIRTFADFGGTMTAHIFCVFLMASIRNCSMKSKLLL